jgi:hypothetical protein
MPNTYTDKDAVLSNDMADSFHLHLTEKSLKNTEDAVTSTELSKNVSASWPVDDVTECIAFIDSRSLGCQTVDLRNLDDLYNVAMINIHRLESCLALSWVQKRGFRHVKWSRKVGHHFLTIQHTFQLTAG